jgi:hypothetical protein
MFSIAELNECRRQSHGIWKPFESIIYSDKNKKYITDCTDEINKKKLKKCRELLNKLSKTNFEIIETELTSIMFDNEHIIRQFVTIFLSKSFEEQLYTNIYIQFVKHLLMTNLLFRQILLEEVQRHFQLVIQNKSNLIKIQKLGVIRVVANLFVLKLLSIDEFEKCILYIEQYLRVNCENLIDYYCLLYNICLEFLKCNYPKILEQIHIKMKLIYESEYIGKKDKFTLLDIIEMNLS